MSNMNIGKKKIVASLAMFALLALVSGFCYGTSAAAASVHIHNSEEMNIGMEHCGGQIAKLQQGTPLNNTVMPCCIDRHDNIPTVAPHLENKSLKFFPSAVTPEIVSGENSGLQRLYVSSPSPPPEPDILSSVIKKE
jgi:hypothetical protein